MDGANLDGMFPECVRKPHPRHIASNTGVDDFAQRLRQKTCKQVVLWDEALTTVDAAERLRSAGRKRREAEQDIDMAAAAVILQSYLDEQRRQS